MKDIKLKIEEFLQKEDRILRINSQITLKDMWKTHNKGFVFEDKIVVYEKIDFKDKDIISWNYFDKKDLVNEIVILLQLNDTESFYNQKIEELDIIKSTLKIKIINEKKYNDYLNKKTNVFNIFKESDVKYVFKDGYVYIEYKKIEVEYIRSFFIHIMDFITEMEKK